MDPRFLQKLKGDQQSQHLQGRRKGHILLALDHGPEQGQRDHLLMEYRQGNIKPRQQQTEQQGTVAKHPDTGRSDIIPVVILGALHQAAQVHRGQIAQGNAIGQESHPSIQQP